MNTERPTPAPCQCEICLEQRRLRQLERELAEALKENNKPEWCCHQCGSFGPFENIIYPDTPNGPAEYDIKCEECGSLDVCENPREVVQHWIQEAKDAKEELAEAREELARLNKMRTHCERCGGDYMATGLDAECPCLIKQSRDVWKASCDEADCDVLRLKEELARLKAQPQPLPRPDEAGWLPGPANGGGGTAGPCTEKYPSGQWWDGDELLVAVDVRSNVTGEEWKEYHAVRILCDEESFHVERMDDGDDIGWGPESWSWYMPIPSLPATLPPAPEKGVEG